MKTTPRQKPKSGAKWLPGAMAVAAAGGATQANAATVQITFAGSTLSTVSGNLLVTDYGDDGFADLFPQTFSGLGVGLLSSPTATTVFAGGVGFSGSLGLPGAVVKVGTSSKFVTGSAVASITMRNFAEITFSDTNIRGGASTTGYLDITASATNPGEYILTVHRLIFDDASGGPISGLNTSDSAYTEYSGISAVPEPANNLALLACGAGGLLIRRRMKRVA